MFTLYDSTIRRDDSMCYLALCSNERKYCVLFENKNYSLLLAGSFLVRCCFFFLLCINAKFVIKRRLLKVSAIILYLQNIIIPNLFGALMKFGDKIGRNRLIIVVD